MKKLLIVSDLHGVLSGMEIVLEAMTIHQPDLILCLGDELYHGPRNDIPEDYAPKKVIPLLNSLAERIVAVRGNCDAEVDQMVLEFPIMNDSTAIYENGLLISATHGHLYDEFRLPPLSGIDVLLCGHTHVPALHDHGSFVYMNPGSVSIPKGGSSHSYMTLEDGLFTWKTLDGASYRTFRKEKP